MDIAGLIQRLWNFEIRRLLLIIGVVVVILVASQCFELLHGKNVYFSPAGMLPTSAVTVRMFSNVTSSINSNPSKFNVGGEVGIVVNATKVSDFEEEDRFGNDTKQTHRVFELAPDRNADGKSFRVGTDRKANKTVDSYQEGNEPKTGSEFKVSVVRYENGLVPAVSQGISIENPGNLNADSESNVKQTTETQVGDKQTELWEPVSVTLNDNSTMTSISILKKWNRRPTSISQMNALLLRSPVSSFSMSPRRYSIRDRELQSAKLQIENAPIIWDSPGLSVSVFRNLSQFIKSYVLMERMLKVYIYKEGEKPVFHQPLMRGIYASEGWFMKLIEGNKKFVVKDPKKAHLFYLPFDSHMLRLTIPRQNIHGKSVLEKYLKNYVELISRKYRFWNRTGGADHFLVACHDWAPKLTGQCMKNCIRSLCNANVGRDFKIGKDASLPVTYIRSVENPLADLGGKSASERSILAFFAGGIHGYLRPILLHYWENKEPDMKIFGPMPHDIEGKRRYREYMKSSKYCICARGYEVHTPRIVEAIFYECVPVIISDSYVPPFFEVFNWEAFAVFIQEKDIPDLRNILLSIPEKKYLAMVSRVKMVQRHFFWNKKPAKYDLFHMILHSVWYNRVLQVKTR